MYLGEWGDIARDCGVYGGDTAVEDDEMEEKKSGGTRIEREMSEG